MSGFPPVTFRPRAAADLRGHVGEKFRDLALRITQLAQQFSTQNNDFPSLVAAAVFFILLTIPLARFTDHLVAERERRERAQAF